MWFLRFARPERQDEFVRRALRHGVLFKRGAYNYAAVAHDETAIAEIEAAASAALVALAESEG